MTMISVCISLTMKTGLFTNVFSVGDLPETYILGAVYAGVFANPTPLDVPCPTGNCSFPIYSTLSFCSRCSNGTGYRSFSVDDSNLTYTSQSNISWSVPFPDSPDTSNIGFFVPFANISKMSVAGFHEPIFGFAHFPQATFSSDPTFQDPSASGDPLSARVESTECALTFCIQNMNISVEKTVPSIQVLSSWYYDSVSNQAGRRTSLDPPMSFLVATPANASFSIFPRTLMSYFWMQLSMTAVTSQTDLLSQLSLSTNVTQMMADIAESMRNALLNNALGNDTVGQRQGTSYSMEVFISVRWPWIALPLILVFSSIVLLILVMIQSSKRGTMVWKSSILALLFHGLEPMDEDEVPTHRIAEMSRRAKELNVGIRRNGSDWHFVQSENT